MAVNPFNLPREGQRAERKMLVTVAEWEDTNGNIDDWVQGSDKKFSREILGTRTEDSSIEMNADIEQSTDIRGNNYTDVNKTQPQQDFDPYLVLGGSKLGAKLNDIRRRNALSELDQFRVYIITLYVGTTGAYAAECQKDCTIAITSLGGDSNVNMPISVYFSNKTTLGTVDGIAENFTFSPTLPTSGSN